MPLHDALANVFGNAWTGADWLGSALGSIAWVALKCCEIVWLLFQRVYGVASNMDKFLVNELSKCVDIFCMAI
jgi:hypothetical protein